MVIAPLLEVKNVSRHFPVREGLFGLKKSLVRALDGISLTLEKGETLGLVGESGCGKSTLGKLILALDRPTSGEIVYKGEPLWPDLPEGFRREVQMVFQDPYSSLNPRKRIRDIVGEPLDIHHVGRGEERRQRVAKLLELVGLRPEQAGRYPHEFSGGQRQRVAVARCLALDPELLVCDEPVSALDVSIQAQVINLLKELQDRLKLTYLFISHDLAVVNAVSDRVAVMYLGRLAELSPRPELFSEPLHPYSRALLSAVPVPDPDSGRPRLKLSGELPSPINPPSGCPFHPRCPEAMKVCSERFPDWKEAAPGRFVSCWLY